MKLFFSAALCLAIPLAAFEESSDLFRDLSLVEEINKELRDELPFFYNFSLMGGYYNMPSARMNKDGMVAIGGGRVPPYNIYGVNVQPLDRVEVSGNYRVYTGLTEANFGHEGFGDDAERIGNIKLGVLTPADGFPMLPCIAVGADDFIGTKRFNAQYVVATKEWKRLDLEVSLGWGHGRIKGFFGGAAWSPLRKTKIPFLKDLALVTEYDAIDYKKHPHEHPSGRHVNSRVNVGLNFLGWDALQLSVSSVRGEAVAGYASLRYPLGTTQGFFAKVDDPIAYLSPVDTEPLGVKRHEIDFATQLAFAFSDQGLDLYTAYASYDPLWRKQLWLKVVNNRYREEAVVRERLEHLLCALTPSDVAEVIVVIEADAFPLQSYRYRTEDLYRYREGKISKTELEALAPMIEAEPPPPRYESHLLFQRHKPIWTFTVKPRLISFFGSAKGKYKYALSAVATQEGYLFDQVYYRLQGSYSIHSSVANLSAMDRNNPSELPQVRTDSVRYFQTSTASLEQAYLQKSWNLGKGCFFRLAGGYFEPAYGGGAAEFLWYPVNSSWAIGLEEATVLKRRYSGIAFTKKIRQLKHDRLTHQHFIGVQYFATLYYDFKPLSLDLKIMGGQFLAKDKGVRFEVERYFKSGLRLSVWYTVTNGHDKVNGHTYYDKGFSFLIPLDFFMKQSSRNFVGYAMSAWLRDIGAISATGKPLYFTLTEERW